MARTKGDGSLYKDSRGLWTARVELPRAPDGTRRQKVIRSKDKGKAAEKLRDLNRELILHGDVITTTPTVKDYLTHWIEHVAPHRVRPRTVDAYKASIDGWIIPAIGRIKVQDLTPKHVQAVHDLCRAGYGNRKPLSSTTTLHVHRVLAVALRDAVRAGHLRTNPASKDHVEAPRKRATSTTVLTAEQAWKVLRYVADDPMCARWSVALLTGLRQSEALGLERAAVDLDNDRLIVQWQLQKLKSPPPDHVPSRDLGGGYYLTPPKTMGGMRVIPLVSPLRDVLARHVEALPVTEHDLLFRTEKDRPIHHAADADRWAEILKAAGVPKVRLHDARHTVATMLLSAGTDAHVVQQILGHSSIAMSRHYQHVDTTMTRDALERMSKLLTA